MLERLKNLIANFGDGVERENMKKSPLILTKDDPTLLDLSKRLQKLAEDSWGKMEAHKVEVKNILDVTKSSRDELWLAVKDRLKQLGYEGEAFEIDGGCIFKLEKKNEG